MDWCGECYFVFHSLSLTNINILEKNILSICGFGTNAVNSSDHVAFFYCSAGRSFPAHWCFQAASQISLTTVWWGKMQTWGQYGLNDVWGVFLSTMFLGHTEEECWATKSINLVPPQIFRESFIKRDSSLIFLQKRTQIFEANCF